MRLLSLVITVFLLTTLMVAAALADLPFMSRPGTVSNTLACPDNTKVVLDSMMIDSIAQPYIYIRDPWSNETLPVYADAEFNPYWNLEITGRTATILGTRIVVAGQVRRYTDSSGVLNIPLPKHASAWNWPNMQEISLAPVPSGNLPLPGSSLIENMSMQMMEMETYNLPVGDITLTNVIVTAGRGDDLANNIFYVEKLDRSSGWKVAFAGTTPANIKRGDKVTVVGPAAVDANGEAYIAAGTVTASGTGLVKPIGIGNFALGGRDNADGRPGVNTPIRNHLYNKGLLVTCWGKVKYVNAAGDYFYIDDGSALEDGSGHTGIKVSWNEQAVGADNPEIVPPLQDWYVTVTGISSSESPTEGTVIRVLRPRRQDDILVRDPQDVTNPSVAITDPSGNQVFKLPSMTSVQISGTASDNTGGTGIAYVQVKIDSGEWHNASYSSGTWTYTWNSPVSATITVRAVDFAGNIGSESRSVTVSAPEIIFVKPVADGGSDGNNGWTWGKAKATITDALNTTVTEGEHQVWVAHGEYNGSITLKSGVRLYGGFLGSEAALEERPAPDANPSILNGQGNGTVVTATNVDNQTTIDGFTIKNAGSYPNSGIQCNGTSALSIANNRIENNARGVYYGGPANSWLHHNTITNNVNGVNIEAAGTFVIQDNHIDHNGTSSGQSGVGIRIREYATATIDRNFIEFNGTTQGVEGGGISCVSSTANIYNNVIRCNTAKNGGGVFISGVSTVLMYNNTVVGNTATPYQGNGGYGGAVYSYQSQATLANNIFYSNFGTYGVYANDNQVLVHAYRNSAYLQSGLNYSSKVLVHDGYTSDPNLDPDGYHITANSICRNAANNAFYHGPSDIDGGPRPSVIFDIGADEYGSP